MNSSKGIFPRKILDTIPSFSTKYLSCNRIGGQDVYQKNYGQIDDIGINGEYALFYLQMHKSKRLDSALIYDSSSETLMAQVNYWLNYIVYTNIKSLADCSLLNQSPRLYIMPTKQQPNFSGHENVP